MKKIYTFLAVAAMMASSVATSAQSATEPSTLWAKTIIGNKDKTSMGQDVAHAADGSTYFLSMASTMATTDNITFGDDVIGIGSATSTASGNNNLVLVKVDANGNRLWSVVSTDGDCYSGGSWLAVTADGGVVAAMKLRYTVTATGTSPIAITDATGKSTTISWTQNPAGRNFSMVLAKFSKDGALEWTRIADVDASGEPNATTYKDITSDAIDVYSAVIDADQNIYVSGRFRKTVKLEKADGTFEVLSPLNTAGWNGDSQKTNGDLFLAKFNPNGYCLKTLVSTDSATYSAIKDLRIVGDKIYFDGYMQGRDNGGTVSPVKLGGIDLNLVNTNNGLLVGNVDLDLNVLNAKVFSSSYSGSVYQTTSIDVINDDIFLTGKTRSNLTLGDLTLDASKLTRDGYIIRLDKDFNPKAAIANGLVQSGFMGAFGDTENPDRLYVFGSDKLFGSLFIRQYDKTTLAKSDKEDWTLISSVATHLPMITCNDSVFVQSRIRGSVTFYGGSQLQTTAYNNVVAAFKLPVKTTTAIETVSNDVQATKIYGTQGAIVVNAEKAATVRVYNITGALVASVDAQPGTTTVNLPAGIYIANGTKLIVR